MRFVLTFLLMAVPAFAQTAPAGVTRYPAAFFAGSQPSTALDMVGLLPGFRVQSGDSGLRGFSGSLGNVLIDGRLPTSKEESIEQLLQRIPAVSVDHIELIRGGADMHGYAVLANVIRIDRTALSGRAEAEFAATHFGTSAPRLALHLTRRDTASTLDLSATYGRKIRDNHGFGRRDRFTPDAAPLRLAGYAFPELRNFADFSASYRRGIWGGDLTLGLVLKQQRDYSSVAEHIFFPVSAQSSGLESDRERNGEARLEYQRGIGDWGQLQFFVVHRLEEQDEISQIATATQNDMARSRYNQREDVARLAWQREAGAWKLESGMEGAVNVLSSKSRLNLNGTEVTLPAANLKVRENRAEFFAAATWRLDPQWTMELGAHQEISSLVQRGDSNLRRDLSFFKPRWLTHWDFAPGQELRLLVERQAGQLDFSDFASSSSLNSNIVTAGNKNLEPERRWRLGLTWEWHLWDRASLTLEARRDLVSHVVDHVPVFAGPKLFDAVGNIGAGRRDALEVGLILPLDRLGLEGVTVKGDGGFQFSRVRDPATGLNRRISGDLPFWTNLEIDYDRPMDKLRLGVRLAAEGREIDYRVDEVRADHHGVKLGAFAEYRPKPDWTLRLSAEDIAQTPFFRGRDLYVGQRGAVPPGQIERRVLNNGMVVGFHIQHDF